MLFLYSVSYAKFSLLIRGVELHLFSFVRRKYNLHGKIPIFKIKEIKLILFKTQALLSTSSLILRVVVEKLTMLINVVCRNSLVFKC